MASEIKKSWKKFYEFMKEDSWQSLVVFIVLSLAFLFFIFKPGMAFLLGTSYSLVIVESCSMYHADSLEEILSNPIYQEYDLSFQDTKDWPLKKGFNKGDIIFSVGPKNVEIGDVVIFDSGRSDLRYPIIHRVIRAEETFTTKGDNNPGLLNYEKEISKEQILAKSIFRIPYVGWIKLIFFEWQKDPRQRGLC